jgi:hypothetical protein
MLIGYISLGSEGMGKRKSHSSTSPVPSVAFELEHRVLIALIDRCSHNYPQDIPKFEPRRSQTDSPNPARDRNRSWCLRHLLRLQVP